MRTGEDSKAIYLDIEEVKKLCRPGAGADTCIWLVVGKGGFECLYYRRNEGHNLIGETLEERWRKGLTVAKRDGCDEIRAFKRSEMEVLVGKDEGRWPKGTRVRKVNTRPGDSHRDGAQGTIVGALGPATAAQRAEMIIEAAKNGIDGDIEYIYWVEWDDMPGIPVAIADNRIEPMEELGSRE